jgi:Holliday junction DNA helicase RuvA
VIARLAGTIAEKGDGHAIVDVGGVGYRVHLSQASLARLPPAGERVALRTYTHVREDTLELFGFATEEEEAVFRELIGVKNVGPRAAQNILSGIEARDLAAAVAQGDVVRLTRVPGVGKKTAERLVLELRDKVRELAAAPEAVAAGPGDEDLVSALVNLGYKRPQAERAVIEARRAAPEADFSDLLRASLKKLSRA